MANPLHVLREFLRLRRQRADARARVDLAQGDDTAKAELAAALRALGELERRTPFTRPAALKHYEEAVALYRERYNLIGKRPSVSRRIAGLFGR